MSTLTIAHANLYVGNKQLPADWKNHLRPHNAHSIGTNEGMPHQEFLTTRKKYRFLTGTPTEERNSQRGALDSGVLVRRDLRAEGAAEVLRDGSRDSTVGASGESEEEPDDRQTRDFAALAYLFVTCEALGIEPGEEWDEFMFARAIHRRVRAVLQGDALTNPTARQGSEETDRA